MTDQVMVSYAQNREDVVLHRVLAHIPTGRYIEVGANDPIDDSISYAFYQRGWSGVTIDPVAALMDKHRELRPRDHQVQAAITNRDKDHVVLHEVEMLGLSTIIDEIGDRHLSEGLKVIDVPVPARTLDSVLEEYFRPSDDIHFAVIDTEGAEPQVLSSVDLTKWRPWILVVEATVPQTDWSTADEWESQVLEAGYQFCLFDGLSRFYVADEHRDLARRLSYPACVLDEYITRDKQRLADIIEEQRQLIAARESERGELIEDLLAWRAAAVGEWADAAVAGAGSELALHAQEAIAELDRMRGTISWRVTRPIRAARKIAGHIR